MFDDRIIQITDFVPEEKLAFTNDTLFADIGLNNYFVTATKVSSGIFTSETNIEMTNLQNGSSSMYKINAIPKAITTYQDVIAINLGTEVHFIHVNGWLIKKYTSTRNIEEVVLCSGVAGIVYKDKIELVNL